MFDPKHPDPPMSKECMLMIMDAALRTARANGNDDSVISFIQRNRDAVAARDE